MKNLLFNIFVLTSIIFATATKCDRDKPTEGEQHMYGYEMRYNQRQLDSLFVADTLDPNLNNWVSTYFFDYETKERIVKYMYGKETSNIIYTVTPKDTIFVVNKIEIKDE